jgi:hypothetical protein
MRRKLAIALALLFLLTIPLLATAASYIGNRNSFKFHYESCTWVSRMTPGNKVPFSSREDATAGPARAGGRQSINMPLVTLYKK